MVLMANDKPKVLLILEEDLLKRIDDYRYENQIPARTEAIGRLIKEGLKQYKKKKIDYPPKALLLLHPQGSYNIGVNILINMINKLVCC